MKNVLGYMFLSIMISWTLPMNIIKLLILRVLIVLWNKYYPSQKADLR